jgi:hypothetical protein
MLLKLDKINFDNIKYIQSKKPSFFFIKHQTNERFIFQTPKLHHKYPVRELKGHTTFAEMDIPLDNPILYNFFEGLENKIITNIHENVNNWFGAQLTEVKFKTIIRTDEERPYFRIKLVNNEHYRTKIYQDGLAEETTLSHLELHNTYESYIRLILEIYGLCILDNQISIIIIPHKISVMQIMKDIEFSNELSEEKIDCDELLNSHKKN